MTDPGVSKSSVVAQSATTVPPTNQLREQEYTPTTEGVRDSFILSPGNKDWEAVRLLAFDRWFRGALTDGGNTE